MLVKGNGGKATFVTFDGDFEAGDPIRLEVANWQVRTAAMDADLSSAGVDGSRGGSQGGVTDWTINFPPDTTALPEANGIQAKRAVTVWFAVGDLEGVWHKLTNSLVVLVAPVCDSTGELLRYTIQGRYGTLTEYDAEGPPAPEEDPEDPEDPDEDEGS